MVVLLNGRNRLQRVNRTEERPETRQGPPITCGGASVVSSQAGNGVHKEQDLWAPRLPSPDLSVGMDVAERGWLGVIGG